MKKIEITPDDVIIVKCSDYLTSSRTDYFRNEFKKYFGVEKVFFLDGGLDIEVVRPVSTFIQQVEEALENK